MFERGDRVRVNGVGYDGVNYDGVMGTVVRQGFNSATCLVEIDESRKSVWFFSRELTLCEDEPLQPGNLAGLFK